MVERLKQIWGGFEQTTSRKLTGRGVEGIVLPPRPAERAAQGATPKEAGVAAPAEAAFAALRAELDAHGRKYAKRLRGGDAEPKAATDVSDAPEAARDLMRGLASTEARVGRAFKAYDASMHAAPDRKKRRIFGLF